MIHKNTTLSMLMYSILIVLFANNVSYPQEVTAEEADVIVITHSTLLSSTWKTLYTSIKQSQGLTVHYTTFSDGQLYAANAVKNYLMSLEGVFKYVQIVGDAHRDIEDGIVQDNDETITFSEDQIIPLYRETVQALGLDMTVNSDQPYVSNLEDVRIGRIPASNEIEIMTYLNKVYDYLTSTASPNESVLFLMDDLTNGWNGSNPYFVNQAYERALYSIPWSIETLRTSILQQDPRETWPQAFEYAMNHNTPGYISAIGCSSSPEDIVCLATSGYGLTLTNTDEYPVLLGISCDIGGFDQFIDNQEYDSIVEELLFTEDGGIIASIAPSMAMYQQGVSFLMYTLWSRVIDGNIGCMGDIIPEMKENYPDYGSAYDYHTDMQILLGDPTLPLPHFSRYSNVTINTTQTIPAGDYYISGAIDIVSGGQLTLDPGANLKFANENSGIIIRGTGKLIAQGTSQNKITLSGVTSNRNCWAGLRYLDTASATGQVLEHVVISNAEKAVKTKLAAGAFIPKYVEIYDCETAVSAEYAFYTYLQEFDIHDCTNGIFVSHPGSVNSFTAYDSDIYDISETGIELNGLGYGSAYVISSRIHDCGTTGLYVNEINKLNIGSATGLTDYATRIYNCGSADEYSTPAVDIRGSVYINRLEDLQVYENLACGVYLLGGVTVNTDPAEHGMVAIGNNQLEADPSYELTIGTNCTFDFGNHQYNLFNDMVVPTPIIVNLANNQLTNAENTWWGESLTDIPSVTSHLMFGGTSTVDLDPMATSSHGGATWYPGTSSLEDSPEVILHQAYALLDTFDTPEINLAQAADLFEQLVLEGYVPGIYGLAQALLIQDQSATQIDAALDALVLNASSDMIRAREFLRGDVRVRTGEFDSAQLNYQTYADNAPTVFDSLHAELNSEETARLQLLLEESRGGDLAGFPESATYRLDEIETHLKDLRSQMLARIGDPIVRQPLPENFELKAAYPNPFNPSVTIPFALPEKMDVTLAIYNVLGQRVKTLINKPMSAGYHSTVWDGRGQANAEVASGLYFIQIQVPGHVQTQKIIMLK